jgi:hypothetical protein
VDGCDKEWEHGAPSVWEGGLSQFDPRDQATKEAFALQPLRSHTSICNYDASQKGAGGNLADDLAADGEDLPRHIMELVPGNPSV